MRFRRKNRKNFRNVVLIVLLILFLFTWNKRKQSPPTNYYIATTELNVRTRAGTGYSVGFTLEKGDEVEILSKEKNWYKIKYLEKTGYAHSNFLQFSRTENTAIDTKFLFPQELMNKILIGLCMVLGLFIIYVVYTKLRDKYLLERVTDKSRGTSSERNLVSKLLKFGIPTEKQGKVAEADAVAGVLS